MSDCRCAGIRGAEPINEACGGCCGCIEAQMMYSMDNQEKEIQKLKEENKLLREAVGKCAQLDCNSYLAERLLAKIKGDV